jgi:hypothetical protein
VSALADTVVREPGAESAEQYAQRVHRLALAYVCLFVVSLVGIVLLIWQGQFFVTLTQRSNVETLTIAFFIVLFAYVAFLSAPGAYGAAHIAYFAALRARGRDWREVERAKMRRLGDRPEAVRTPPPCVALNTMVTSDLAPQQFVSLAVADEAGGIGRLVFDGAELRHEECQGVSSNGLLAFAVHQVNDLLRRRGLTEPVKIVEWMSTDDESTEQYLGLVRFARNLERHLGADELWPKVRLTASDCSELERRLREVCPNVRSEAFLPDWEYSAEHKLPIVPEPLGLVSLSRNERRADPVATMGCAVMVVVGAVAIIGLLILFPPWVPGS